MITAAVLWMMQELSLLLGIVRTALYPFGMTIHWWILLPAVLGFGLSAKRKEWILLGAAGVLFPGLEAAERVIAAVFFVKTYIDLRRNRYLPHTNTVESVMKTLVLVYAVLFICILMMEHADAAGRALLECAVLSLGAGILLKRTLRHDPAVYDQPGFQAANLLSITGAVLCGVVLRTEAVRSAAAAVLLFGWKRLFLPAVSLLVYIMALPMVALGWLLAKLHISFGTDMQDMAETIMEETNGLHFDQPVITVRERVSLFVPLMILLVLIVIVILYRSWKNGSTFREPLLSADTPAEHTVVRTSQDHGEVMKIRRIYRKYLKRTERNHPLVPKDTTLSVLNRNKYLWPGPEQEEMRELYVRARYRGSAAKSDTARMKELYAQMIRKENKE